MGSDVSNYSGELKSADGQRPMWSLRTRLQEDCMSCLHGSLQDSHVLKKSSNERSSRRLVELHLKMTKEVDPENGIPKKIWFIIFPNKGKLKV